MPLPVQNGEGLSLMGDLSCQKKELLELQHQQKMKKSLSCLLLKKVNRVGLSADTNTLIGDTVKLPLKHHKQADVDGNGVLDYGEFVAVTIHLQRMENDEHFRKAFMFFDKDGSGYIEFGELETALVDESGENDTAVLNDIMREVDTDKDGRISYEEFVAMMKTGTDWRKASRQYSRERFKSLSINLMKDGSLQLQDGISGQAIVV